MSLEALDPVEALQSLYERALEEVRACRTYALKHGHAHHAGWAHELEAWLASRGQEILDRLIEQAKASPSAARRLTEAAQALARLPDAIHPTKLEARLTWAGDALVLLSEAESSSRRPS